METHSFLWNPFPSHHQPVVCHPTQPNTHHPTIHPSLSCTTHAKVTRLQKSGAVRLVAPLQRNTTNIRYTVISASYISQMWRCSAPSSLPARLSSPRVARYVNTLLSSVFNRGQLRTPTKNTPMMFVLVGSAMDLPHCALSRLLTHSYKNSLHSPLQLSLTHKLGHSLLYIINICIYSLDSP